MTRRRATASTNGRTNGRLRHVDYDPILLNRLDRFKNELIANFSTSRKDWLQQLTDDRRDINDECGYPKTTPSAQTFQWTYERNPIAARVVEILPKECSQVSPDIFEVARGPARTPWELALKQLGKDLLSEGEQSWYEPEEGNPLETYVTDVDILSGIGQYGVMVLGFDDDKPLREPVDGVVERGSMPSDVERDVNGRPILKEAEEKGQPPQLTFISNAKLDECERTGRWPRFAVNGPASPNGRKLLYIRCMGEHLAQVTRFESNKNSPRYGQPTAYLIQFNDPSLNYGGYGLPLSSQEVHWTRVVHVADTNHTAAGGQRVFAVPRCWPVWNRLLDCEKEHAADGESYWRNCMLKLFFETHPQLGGDVDVDLDDFRSQIEQMMNGLQQWMFLRGNSAKPIAPQVVDPTPHIDVAITAICIKGSYPKRVFMGSERGELASTSDEDKWNKRLKQRNKDYKGPRIWVPLLNRLTMVGVLPQPKRYVVAWPDVDAASDSEKADIGVKRTQMLTQYNQSGAEAEFPRFEFYTKIMNLSDEEAKGVIAAAEKQQMGESDMGALQPQGDALPPEPAAPVQPQESPQPGLGGQPPQLQHNELTLDEHMCWGKPCGETMGPDEKGGGGGSEPHTPESVAKVGDEHIAKLRQVEDSLGPRASDKKKVAALTEAMKEGTAKLDKIATDNPKLAKQVADQKTRLGAFVRVHNEEQP